MKERRGQFFLISALILILVIFSLTSYKVLTRKNSFRQSVTPLGEEIYDESGWVIDYGLYNNEDNLNAFLSELSSKILNENQNIELVYFFGNSTHINVLNLGEEKIVLDLDGNKVEVENIEKFSNIGLGDTSTRVKVDLNNENIKSKIKILERRGINFIKFRLNETEYVIDLKEGKKFYFLIKRSEGDERYVEIK